MECNHGTHQDRLVKKLRLKKIGSYEAANRYLAEQYPAEHNRRFAIEPEAAEDYHVKAPQRTELEDVFRLENERVIGNDWVVRYESRYFQVERRGRQYAPAKGKVTVCEWEDGRLEIRYRGAKVAYTEIAAPPKRTPRNSGKLREANSPQARPSRIIPGGKTTATCGYGQRQPPARRMHLGAPPPLRPKRTACGGVPKCIRAERGDISNVG